MTEAEINRLSVLLREREENCLSAYLRFRLEDSIPESDGALFVLLGGFVEMRLLGAQAFRGPYPSNDIDYDGFRVWLAGWSAACRLISDGRVL